MLPQAWCRAEKPTAPSLEFIENKGQWDARVRFAAPLHHGRLFVENTKLTYALREPVDLHPHAERTNHGPLRAHAYAVEFVDASPNVKLNSATATGEVRNYLLGNDAAHWAREVGSFRQVHYTGLWAGVDAKLYENNQQQLEYDFQLAPQANAQQVQLRYTGADAVTLQPDGSLRIQTSVGHVTELAPKAWQLDAQNRRQAVACRYVVNKNVVSFALGRYDHTRALVIDPTVVFSSFTGSTVDNWGFTATFDQQGNMYSGGIAFGTGYPVTTGAYNTSFSGSIDIAIIKYNTAVSGTGARVWATYLGGSSADYPQSLVVNSRGELVVLATTGSANYPVTTTAFDRSFNSGTVINPYGSDPQYNITTGTDLAISSLNSNATARRWWVLRTWAAAATRA
ncbi:hypothetical protein GCM10023186_23040 [Hymenobacter koreensis]|uniref:DUF7948 domain-containing protein n=2 Tax=Hymenobacter koreensis TaxID=1084523 RepID=A0ABP8J087_9BACT